MGLSGWVSGRVAPGQQPGPRLVEAGRGCGGRSAGLPPARPRAVHPRCCTQPTSSLVGCSKGKRGPLVGVPGEREGLGAALGGAGVRAGAGRRRQSTHHCGAACLPCGWSGCTRMAREECWWAGRLRGGAWVGWGGVGWMVGLGRVPVPVPGACASQTRAAGCHQPLRSGAHCLPCGWVMLADCAVQFHDSCRRPVKGAGGAGRASGVAGMGAGADAMPGQVPPPHSDADCLDHGVECAVALSGRVHTVGGLAS